MIKDGDTHLEGRDAEGKVWERARNVHAPSRRAILPAPPWLAKPEALGTPLFGDFYDGFIM